MADKLPPGWAKRPGAHLLDEFWLDGYEPEPDQDRPRPEARPRTDGVYAYSPLYEMQSDLGGVVQWVNADAGQALLLRADGLRQDGGQWRVFICDRLGARPRELTTEGQFSYPPNDLHTWGSTERLARAWALDQIS